MTSLLSRRSFLTRSALAGGLTLLAPHARAAGSNSELRVAVIGVRGRGRGLAESILKSKGARLVAICDVDPSVLHEQSDKLGKQGVKVANYADYRKLCEAEEIDAVVIATPNHTHSLIAITAAVNGKHAYVEKPVSHNVWEGRQLATAQSVFGVVIQHGFQRRSETSWHEAFDWISQGHLGKLKVARGFCYKPRPSIGKVKGPQLAPEGLDYDLWCGPRPRTPILRKQFHYDWHWQFQWGNGDLGNQAPHQLDVCRWALGDPDSMPRSVLSCGNRFGYDDNGEWANTQLVSLDYETAPILFEVRGLPSRNMDYKSGMDRYRGLSIGNVIEYEGGALLGGHSADCWIVDHDGKKMREFKGSKSHVQTWIDSIHSGEQAPMLSAKSGHLSSALAHLGNISWLLGSTANGPEKLEDPLLLEAFNRMNQHLSANGIEFDKSPIRIGPKLTPEPDGAAFVGEFKPRADALLSEQYREAFKLPI